MNDDFEMISEPLLTDEGLVNPVCIAQLEAAIKNMPETYERLADEPEWNTPRWTFLREVTSYVAHWAIRNIARPDNTPTPPGLEGVIGYLHACIRPRFNECEMAELSLCDINRLLHEILMPEKFFQVWNDERVLKGWLDLHALLHNVCVSIRNERRKNDVFDKQFEAEHADFGHGEAI